MSTLQPINGFARPADRDSQNRRMTRDIERLSQATAELIAHGYSVLALGVVDRGPEIWIANSPRCDALGGRSYRRVHTPDGTVWHYITEVEGVVVKWIRRES